MIRPSWFFKVLFNPRTWRAIGTLERARRSLDRRFQEIRSQGDFTEMRANLLAQTLLIETMKTIYEEGAG
jgi:hypothetical protein